MRGVGDPGNFSGNQHGKTFNLVMNKNWLVRVYRGLY